jgi:hypothetical protein
VKTVQCNKEGPGGRRQKEKERQREGKGGEVTEDGAYMGHRKGREARGKETCRDMES